MPRPGFVLRLGFALALAASLGAPGAGVTPARRGPAPASVEPAHAPHEILIKFHPHTDRGSRAAVRDQLQAQHRRTFRSGAQHWRLPPGLTTEEAIARLRRHPLVQYVEPNHRLAIDVRPDDPLYPGLWGLNNTGQEGGTPGADIAAERAWDVSTGRRGVLVAVIDTGVDYTHADLAPNVWTNPEEIPGNEADDDGNGFVDDVHGYDFFHDDGDPMDDNGHGTHVAGTIGAVGNNGTGVAGVAWEATLLPLKFLGPGGYGYTDGAVAAIDYATGAGAGVLNNSWGGGGFSQTLLEAIRRSHEAGGLFVAAAGNNGTSTDQLPNYPANYDVPNVISVAASDPRDRLAGFSNFGRLTVDLAAPGVSITSTFPGNRYIGLSGTSMAAPHVSGVAALMRSLAPGAPPELLKERLMATVDPLPEFAEITVSGGRLDAFTALATRDDVPPGQVGGLEVVREFSNSIELRWIAAGDDGPAGQAAAYDVRWSDAPLDPAALDAAPRASGSPRPSPAGQSDTMEVGGLSPGTTWYIAVRARDEWGNAGPPAFASGTTLPPPAFGSSPASLWFDLPEGGAGSTAIVVRNEGVGSLDWSILRTASGSAGSFNAASAPALDGTPGKDDPDPREGSPVTLGSGGPDRFGHRFDDSSEPGGPAFRWTDMTRGAEVIESLSGDDQVSGPIALGFRFPFYGHAWDNIHVSTNGWISLSEATAFPVNQPLASAAGPGLLIAPFWDDLDFGGTPRARFRRLDGALVVEYRDAGRYRDDGRYTFQVELRATGEILFAYLDMEGPTTSATIGIQDAAADALQVAFNAPYVRSGLAVRIRQDVPWWIAAPDSGRLMAGEQQAVAVEVSASGFPAGIHESAILIVTNDPSRPAVSHPITLRVAGEPGLRADPAAIDFGDVPAGMGAVREVRLINTGTEPLDLTLLASDPAITLTASSVSIPPAGSRLTLASWLPASEGALGAALDIDGTVPLRVPVQGRSTAGAGLAAQPASVHEELAGGRVTRSMRLTNTGGAPLAVSIGAEAGGPPVQSGAEAAAVPGDPPSTRIASAPLGTVPAVRSLYPPVTARRPRPAGVADGAMTSPAPGAIHNGGFETGGFDGWQVTHTGAAWDWYVREAGAGFFRNSDPAEGSLDALNSFDGEAGTRYTLARDLAIPAGVARALLSFRDRVQFDSYGRSSTLPRVYEAGIRAQDGTLLAPITRQEIHLDGRGYTDRGWVRREVDLARFAGSTVRLLIEQSVPERWTGPAQIEFDDFRLDVTAMPDWLQVAPSAALIPPGGSFDLMLTLDASGAPSGLYRGGVLLEGVPGAETLRVPVAMTALPVPRLEMLGGPVHVASVRSYASAGATTHHVLPFPVMPEAGGDVHLEVQGTYSYSDQGAFLSMEDQVHAGISGLGEDCARGRRTVAVDAATLARIAEDGVAEATVRNESVVPTYCPVNEHRVSMTYRGPAGAIVFPETFAGDASEGSIEVFNTGDGDLVVGAAAGDPVFRALDGQVVVAPRQSALLKVQFRPAGPAEHSGTMSLTTNDPLRPRVDVHLRGRGAIPPAAAIEPVEVEAALLSGTTATRSLTLFNRGGSTLKASLSVRASSRAFTAGVTACEPERVLVSEFDKGTLASIDLATGTATRIASELSAPNRGIVPLQDTEHALVVESFSGELSRVDLETGETTTVARGLGFPTSVVVTPDETTAYVADPSSSAIHRVSLATGSVSSVPGSFDLPNALAMDRDGIHLFVADFLDEGIYRLDPFTGAITTVVRPLSLPNDLALDPQGETLYVVETPGRVAAVDLATGNVTRVASGFLQPVGIGVGEEAVYVSDYGTGTVMRIDRVTGAIAPLAAGLAGPVGGAPDGSCARFASIEPRSVTIAPGGSVPLDLTLDSADLPEGRHAGLLRIAVNDPSRPVVDVPLGLTVLDAPDIDLRGEPVRIELTQPYDTRAATTLHEMRMAAPVAGPGVLDVIAVGDFGDESELVSVWGEDGTVLLSAGAGGTDCSPAIASFVVPEAVLSAWASDGVVRFQARNSFDVDPICGTNEHRLSLSYTARADRLDFGTVFTGATQTRRLVVRNRGTGMLTVSPGATGGFTVPSSLSVPTRGQASLDVSFSPSAPVQAAGHLTLDSNDPDEPSLVVPLTAAAAPAPRLEVDPPELDLAVPGDAPLTATLEIANDGGSPLAVSLVAAAGPGAARIPVVESLPDSPAPLTGLVSDAPAGVIHALERGGRRLFRYEPEGRTWRELSPAPLSSSGVVGAALLAGRIYTIDDRNAADMQVYDIAADTWSVREHPLRSLTAAIASDGVRFLYLAAGRRVIRFDPVTSEARDMADSPFPTTESGGLRVSRGMLHAHQGGGSTGFAAFDLASGFWTLLPDLPAGGARPGASFDEAEGAYLAAGRAGPHLFRFDSIVARWTVYSFPGLPVVDGGLAWLPTPEPAVYAAQGSGGTRFARLVRPPRFISLSESEIHVPPLDRKVVRVTVDPATLIAGSYEARIEMETNDPARPQAVVPLHLDVTPVARLDVRAGSVRRMSFLPHDGPLSSTRHDLPMPGPPAAEGTIELEAHGAFEWLQDAASVSLEGTVLGTVRREEGLCEPVLGRFVVPRAALDRAFEDGVAEVTVSNSAHAGTGCSLRRHTVALTYPLRLDRLDFGEVRIGLSSTRPLQVLNAGNAVLDVALAADAPGFVIAPSALRLPPGGAAMVDVSFLPESRGRIDGTLRIESNGGRRDISLSAIGFEAQRALASPDPMRVALPPGGSGVRALELSNAGERDLEWVMSTRYEPLPGAVGPDGGGYVFRDSDRPGGPGFSWVDITEIGTTLPIFRDDEMRGPFPIGFEFPFYGQRFSTVNVSSNGYLSFTSTINVRHGGGTLPNPGASSPENLIAPLWTDLDFDEERKALFHSDGERFVVQYNGVRPKNESGSSVTFQVILHRSGRIVFQYLSIGPGPGTVTVGTQNADRTIGLLVSSSFAWLHDGLAVEIVPRAWMNPGVRSGVLEGDSALLIPLVFDAAAVEGGDHRGGLTFSTSDPVRPAFEVPVVLHVGEIAPEDLDIDPGTLNLASRGRTVRARIQLPAGYDPHAVLMPSLRIDGTLPALPGPPEFADETEDGVEEIIARFDRFAFEQLLAPGDNMVTLTGEVDGVTWFRGTAPVRAIKPRLLHPNGGEVLAAGAPFTVAWEAAPLHVASYSVELSRDGGLSWEPITTAPVAGTSVSWIPAGAATPAAMLRVTASDARGPAGDDTSDAPFTLAAPIRPDGGVDLSLHRDSRGVLLRWSAPPGPHRVLWSQSPRGPFTPAAVVDGSLWPDALPAPQEGDAIFYRVVPAPVSREEDAGSMP